MSCRSLAVAAALVCASAPVAAHQLDEYVQAARLDVHADRVVVELALTPGVEVAPDILAGIDRDGDGALSSSEIDAYAARAVSQLSLSIDGHIHALAVGSVQSPPRDSMRDGTGTIRIVASAAVALAAGSHRVVFRNDHVLSRSTYLVNALQPGDRRIALGAPKRDPAQRRFELDVEITTAHTSAIWLGTAVAFLLPLITIRRRRTPHSHD